MTSAWYMQDVNPVQYSILHEGAVDVGYVRVIVFAENTPAGVYSAVQDLAV
jgi:C-terminal processing protease CtpA/Prc